MRRLLLAAAVVSAAVVPAVAGAREPISSFSDLGKNETVVVGRVELVPPLGEHDQRIRGIGTKRFKNKMFMIVDTEYRELTEEPGRKDFKGRIDATYGDDFMVRSGDEPFFVIAGMMYLSMGYGPPDPAYFPGGFKAEIRPGDKAVYIGTIRYHRNEFFEITKVEVVDEFDRANAEFTTEFGTQHPLRKALLKPVN